MGVESTVEHYQLLGNFVADVQVDDPVHQVEADESDGKEDPWVLIDVRWAEKEAYHTVQFGLPSVTGCISSTIMVSKYLVLKLEFFL